MVGTFKGMEGRKCLADTNISRNPKMAAVTFVQGKTPPLPPRQSRKPIFTIKILRLVLDYPSAANCG